MKKITACCRFCGEEKDFYIEESKLGLGNQVTCGNCHASGPIEYTTNEAIENFNTTPDIWAGLELDKYIKRTQDTLIEAGLNLSDEQNEAVVATLSLIYNGKIEGIRVIK